MSNAVEMPGPVMIRAYTEVDDGRWGLTDKILEDPGERRRLVRTQIEELKTLYQQYPLPEFDAVEQILSQLQQAYRDVEPFNRRMLAAMDGDDED
jgi:hypothetical protein